MSLVERIDAAISGRVLLFGSLPPIARDLDLLVRPEQADELARSLEAAGFTRRGNTWARFDRCEVEVVDLVPATGWGLPPDELESLFEQAVPVGNAGNVVRPSPHHQLLILARRIARGDGRLDSKRRGRIDEALSEAPDAWLEAGRRTSLWGAETALASLEELHARGRKVSSVRRVRALTERYEAGGNSGADARVKAIKQVRPRRPRGAVVSFSGLDGSGKTSQAKYLRESLQRLGYDAVIEWTRLSYNPSLDWIASPVKVVMRLLRRTKTPKAGHRPSAGALPDPAKELRRSSPWITRLWATVVSLANVSSQWKATRAHVRAGRIVLCDRYSLDSAVHLRYRYGVDESFAFQNWLVRRLSLVPLASFWLDVPAEVALERKTEQYTLGQLELQRRLYQEECAALEVTRFDGTRPREELCLEVIHAVWDGLD